MDHFGIINWRDLDLKQNIHYCKDHNKSNVFKKQDKWVHNEIGNNIELCPYCNENLIEWENKQILDEIWEDIDDAFSREKIIERTMAKGRTKEFAEEALLTVMNWIVSKKKRT